MNRSGIVCFLLAWLCMAQAWAEKSVPQFRQPAYISNAYFADQLRESTAGQMQPRAILRALRASSSGPLGHLVLDLIPVKPGRHHLRVDVLNQQGEKAGEFSFPEMVVLQRGELPLYTASVPISGQFAAGVWFFKIYDQVDHGTWYALDTLAILVSATAQDAARVGAQPRQQQGGENE
ncbi:MAG: hypothetical protein HQM06_05445 [Magnetococcales bacterium]|nr:hypothetical protein [Magnetococcales bacterium]